MKRVSDISNGPVVAGVDGSVVARTATRWAAREATRRKAPLRLVYGDVFALPALPELPGLPWPREHRAEVRHEVQRWLTQAAEDAEQVSPGLSVETQSCPGTPEHVLIEESRSAALVVVGDRGLGGFDGLLAGSVAVAVATHAHCPTAVVRQPSTDTSLPTTAPVIVGIDGSHHAHAALAYAFDVADSLHVPLHVVHTWHVAGFSDEALRTVEGWEDLRQHEHRMVAEVLAGWNEKYPDVAVERFTGPGSPAAELLHRAEDAQLVVVGSRGRGGFTGMLLGSTSNALIHHATCPVVVARDGKRHRGGIRHTDL